MTRRIWLISTAVGLFLAGCCEEGSGVLVQETRSVERFGGLRLDLPGTVQVSQGPASPLKIRTDDNLIDRVITSVDEDGALVIKADEEDCCIEPTELVVQVSSPELRELVIDGSGDAVLRGTFESDREISLEIDGSGSIAADRLAADDIHLAIDGSGVIDATLDAGRLRTSLDGSGHIQLAGTAEEHSIAIDGSGDVEAMALDTATTLIDIDGSGECAVAAGELLEVSIDGSGEVSFCGQPRVSQSIDGSGSVEEASRSRCEP